MCPESHLWQRVKEGGCICRVSALQAETPGAATVFTSVYSWVSAVFGNVAWDYFPDRICHWADSKPTLPALGMVRRCPPENADASVSQQVTVHAERWQAEVYCLSSILQGDSAGRGGRDSADDLSSHCSWVREGCGFCISVFWSLEQSSWYITVKSVQWVWGLNPQLLFFDWSFGERRYTVKMTLESQTMYYLRIKKVLMIPELYGITLGCFSICF